MKNKKIAIIGGTGQFGQHLAEEFEKDNEVIISGKTIEEAREVGEKHGWRYGTNKEVVKNVDIVVIAVPIDVTVDVIEEVGPQISRDTLLCDITSVKKKPVEAMKKYSNEVLGMHPMYAPTNSISGQKVVLCPIEGEKWNVMKDFWNKRGAQINITDPETHDKAMSIVQGIIHFSEMVIAETLSRNELDSGEMDKFSSPIYRLVVDMVARMMNQNAELYGSIQKENPENAKIRSDFIDSAQHMKSVIEDNGDFESKFEELGDNLDCDGAQERTDQIIEFLSNKVMD